MDEFLKNNEENPQADGSAHQSNKAVPKGVVIALAVGMSVLALVCIGLVFYIVSNQKNTVQNFNSNADTQELEVLEEKVDAEIEEEPVLGLDELGSYTSKSNSPLREYGELFKPGELVVNWHKGSKPISDVEMMKLLDGLDTQIDTEEERGVFCSKEDEGSGVCTFDWTKVTLCEEDPGCKLSLFEAGVIEQPKELQGLKLYYFFIPEMGMGLYQRQYMVFVDPNLNKFISIHTPPVEDWNFGHLRQYIWFGGTVNYSFPEFIVPEKINIPDEESYLISKDGYKIDFEDWGWNSAQQNSGGIVDVVNKKIVKLSGKKVFESPQNGPVYFDGTQYYVILPDGAHRVYEYFPYFLKEWQPNAEEKNMYELSYAANIDWYVNEDLNSDDVYALGGDITVGGCGSGINSFTNVVSNKQWFDPGKLIQIGETSTGEPVYELSDKKTNSYYTDLFNFGYEGSLVRTYGYENVPELTDAQKRENFDNDTPLFFWKDPMGNWRSYRKTKYQTLAECGKPVIYLYPEKTTDVRVQVAPNGGFTYTDPQYPRDGWFVRAEPNGALYNFANKTQYPYLFWEGHADGFGFPKQGFVFSKDEVPSGMRAVLAKTGLQGQEIEDFMEFWEEKMIKKPYVFVTFARQPDFEQSAPLRVTPAPDTVIRVFMNFELLDAPIAAEPLKIRTPERKGFTVVEWGGVLDR